MSMLRRLSTARFCPFCGVECLERDSVQGFKNNFIEYVCTSCGAGFRIVESQRAQMAARLFKAHREQRPPSENPIKNQEQFNAICKRKYREFKKAVVQQGRHEIGSMMRDWLQGEEARDIRDQLGVKEQTFQRRRMRRAETNPQRAETPGRRETEKGSGT